MQEPDPHNHNDQDNSILITMLGILALIALIYNFAKAGFSSEELIITITVSLFLTIIGGYFGQWRWAGFSSYIIEKTSTEIDESTGNTKITVIREKQPAKTLWDWMQLFIIPMVIAAATLVFSQINTQNQLEIATDNQREAVLQAYLDKMSELLINNTEITEITPAVRGVARTRTLAVLRQLDGQRKGFVLQFLYDLGSISTANNIVNLVDADLHGTILAHAKLDRAELSNLDFQESDLKGALLQDAHLIGTDLRNTDLLMANMTNADLYRAKLQGASLWAAKLIGATLDKADLTNTDLSKADLTNASLIDVIWSNTTCPDRTNSDNNGGTCLNHLTHDYLPTGIP